MREAIGMNGRVREWVGHAAVALILVLALVVSYGCGSGDAPDRTGREGERPAVSSPATVTPVEAEPEELVEPPVRTVPVTRVVTYALAEEAFRERRYEEAVELFTEYTEAKPENPWGFYMLGLSARRAGLPEQAVVEFERALVLDPSHVKSHLNLARALLDLDRVDQAVEHVTAALDLDPESNEAHRLLGRVRAEQGDVQAAVGAYEQALVLNEWDVWSMNNLGVVLMREGRHEEALAPLARAAHLDDDEPLFRNNLGMVLEHLGYFVRASAVYRDAVTLDPAYVKASANLARIEGRADRTGLEVLNLEQVAGGFAEQILAWRAALAELPTVDPLGAVPPETVEPEETPPVAVRDSGVTLPPDTTGAGGSR